MDINWKVRFKNKAFLLSVTSGALLIAKQVASVKGVNIPVEEISTAVDATLGLLVAMGVVIDPTTQGISDSENAMTYTYPH